MDLVLHMKNCIVSFGPPRKLLTRALDRRMDRWICRVAEQTSPVRVAARCRGEEHKHPSQLFRGPTKILSRIFHARLP